MNNCYNNTGCKMAVWNKGSIIKGMRPEMWRKDIFGNRIKYDLHGINHKYGWDIDHYIPQSKGGSNNLENLHPVQLGKNRSMNNKMEDKNVQIWFKALEEKRCLKNVIKTITKKTFPYIEGELLLVAQTPGANMSHAKILEIKRKDKKVLIEWISSGFKEEIEMYPVLFSYLPKKRRV